MKYFSPYTIHLWTAKNFSFYAHLSPHAIKFANHLFFYCRRYFRRLFKEFAFFIPIFLVFLIVINLKTTKSPFEVLKENIQINPNDVKSHNLLAKKFVAANDFLHAQKELSNHSQNSPQVKKINTAKNAPEKIKTEVLLWQQITNLNPTYRDGFVKLAILNWKLYRPFDSTKFIAIAKNLDPNNVALNKFEETLK